MIINAQPLNRGFNVAVNHIASRIFPCGFDVSADAPSTFESLVAHYRETGRVCVWNGASDQTIFADVETNFAFRAWHDSKHILFGLPFTREGEYSAMVYQCRDICALYDGRTAETYCRILAAEICGQFDYAQRHGGFPTDQIGFARAYLGNAEFPGSVPSPIEGAPRFGVSVAA